LSSTRLNFSHSNYGSATDPIKEDFHCHSDDEVPPATDRRAIRVLWASVLICLIFMLCEIIGGYLAHSLAIATDAAHLVCIKIWMPGEIINI
uniref:Zinc transporter 2 n=1 Tax=Gongylonema pulchrum TaxID=637853 RepID=A0A183DKY0_9BILA